MCLFEDAFLTQGNKQLKIQFNPSVSDFKYNVVESQQVTLGAQYPYIKRNGNNYYRTFSLSGLIYDKEDLSLPLQVMFQMGIGFIVLFSVAIYLGWLPLTFGIGVIIEWIIIAIIFASVFWLGFYIYYYLEAREINQKLQ